MQSHSRSVCLPRKKLILYFLLTLVVLFIISTSTSGFTRLPRDYQLESHIAEMQTQLKFLESWYRARQEDIVNILQHKVDAESNDTSLPSNIYDIQSTIPPDLAALLNNDSDSMVSQGLRPKKMPLMNAVFVLHLLPHLMNNPANLRPAFHMQGNRDFAKIVIGIPTVKRDKESYLMDTLTHLIDGASEEDLKETLIVIYVGETDLKFVVKTAIEIEARFKPHVKSGLIEVLSPSPGYYPDFNSIPLTLGDSAKRVKWRTKENLDAAYVMAYGLTRATYYLMIEDDVIAKKDYLKYIKEFTASTSVSKPDWFVLDFCKAGSIGKLFKSSTAVDFVTYIQLFYYNLPIDWLLNSFIEDRGSADDKAKNSKYSNNQPTHFPHNNPPTREIKTDIEVHTTYDMNKAYKGESFFWGINPKAGSVAEYWFNEPLDLVSYTFRSGNTLHPTDKLRDTVVEVYPHNTKEFVVINSFDEFGLADGDIKEELRPIDAIRIRVTNTINHWIVISEIELITAEQKKSN